MTTVTEPGLYSLILRSRKPEAKRFKRWITHDVLPSIRRRGYYIASELEGEALSVMPFALEPFLRALATDVAEIKEILSSPKRKRVRPWQRKVHEQFVADRYASLCPCCEKTVIVEREQLIPKAEYDHFYQPHLDGLKGAWPICRECHREFGPPHGAETRGEKRTYFDYYQKRLAEYLVSHQSLLLDALHRDNRDGQPSLFGVKGGDSL